jgi:capsule polysaccharide export protein KpsE/RkpR
MTHLTQAQTQLRQLLVDLERANAPRIASLTATEAQDIRKGLLEKVEKIIAELYAVRNAGQLAKEGRSMYTMRWGRCFAWQRVYGIS